MQATCGRLIGNQNTLMMSAQKLTQGCGDVWKRTFFVWKHRKLISSLNVTLSKEYRRSLLTTSSCLVRFYQDAENTYAHSVMEKIPEYKDTLFLKNHHQVENVTKEKFVELLQVDWLQAKADEIESAFATISQHCAACPQDISDEKFNNIAKAVVSTCTHWNEDQLLRAIQNLMLWPETEATTTRNFKEIWNALDIACVTNMNDWKVKQLLYVADHWYNLHLSGINSYNWKLIRRLGKHPKWLSPQDLVQTMFYINLYRKVHPSVNMYEFEYILSNCIDKLSAEEISIIAMGFFKTQTPVRSTQIVEKIITLTTRSMESLHDISLCALLKIIRKSMQVSLVPQLEDLLDVSCRHISKFNLMTCLQMGLVGTNFQIFHKECLRAVVKKYLSDLQSARLKDLERLAYIITSCGNDDLSPDADALTAIEKELCSPCRIKEIEKYPQTFGSVVHFLMFRKPYPAELLEKVTQPGYITKGYGRASQHIKREIFMIDMTLNVQCPEFPARCLDDKTLRRVLKRNMGFVPLHTSEKIPNVYKYLWNVEDILGEWFSKDKNQKYLHVTHVLPHFYVADLVFWLDPEGNPNPLPENFLQQPLTDIKKPISKLGTWYCVVYQGKGAYIRNTVQPLGITRLKVEQLREVGYHVVEIPWFEWEVASTFLKKEFLRNKINLNWQNCPSEHTAVGQD